MGKGIFSVSAAALGLMLGVNANVVHAGDFASPSAAPLDGSFRNTRLSMENNRQSHNNAALARMQAGEMNGNGGVGAGSLYDEYQNAGAYQNVIWVPLENIGDNTTINVSIGDSQQSATDSNVDASNEISACSNNILNSSGNCESH